MDKLLILLAVGALPFLQIDSVLVAAYMFAIPYLIITKRKDLLFHLLVASGMAIVWAYIAKEQYKYNQPFFAIGEYSIFPFFAWSGGLFGAYLIYTHYEKILNLQKFVWKFAFFAGSFWTLLIFVETLAYHVFKLRNVASGIYKGLPICDCLHAPPWMQFAYLTMGPVFFLVCYLLRLEKKRLEL